MITYVWWEVNFPSFLRTLLQLLLPPFNLVKFLSDAAELGVSKQVLNESTGKMEWAASGGLDWVNLGNYSVNRSAFLTYDQLTMPPEEGFYVPPPPSESLVWLVAQLLVFIVASWYFAQICTAGDARPQPPYFFLLPSYWIGGGSSGRSLRELRIRLKSQRPDLGAVDPEDPFGVQEQKTDIDSDVLAEIAKVCSGEGKQDAETTVELLDLRKTFTSYVRQAPSHYSELPS